MLGGAQPPDLADGRGNLAGNSRYLAGDIAIGLATRQAFKLIAGRGCPLRADIGAHRFERVNRIGKSFAVGSRQALDVPHRPGHPRFEYPENALKKRSAPADPAQIGDDVAVDDRLIRPVHHG
jgi:hypothetical protein